jgi:predicted homoserine dehydrogenase-like protein
VARGKLVPASLKLTKPIAQGAIVTRSDVEADPDDPTVALHREIEQAFPPAT